MTNAIEVSGLTKTYSGKTVVNICDDERGAGRDRRLSGPERFRQDDDDPHHVRALDARQRSRGGCWAMTSTPRA